MTASAAETEKLGAEIARKLPIPGVILLRGPLGSGKTTLTRGIALGLGVPDVSVVCSPSFTLINRYQGSCPIYHVDLFRLSGARDLYSIGLEEFLGKDGVTVVEWSERLDFPCVAALQIQLEYREGDVRVLQISHPSKMRPFATTPSRKARRARAGTPLKRV
jgi:tRNA threonylcarbamoyladenosine biosynthesis protein TsaE